jgi:DNA-directed RNA polymerase specialized sigma subunit
MSDDAFADIKESIEDALAFERGERRNLNVTRMTLQELRLVRKLTQVRMAKTLGISQDGVSRLEKRSDPNRS